MYSYIYFQPSIFLYAVINYTYSRNLAMATINAVSNVNLFTKSMVTKIAAVHVDVPELNS